MVDMFFFNGNRIVTAAKHLTMTLVLVVASGLASSEVRADGSVRIQFDVGNVVGCKDVTPADFAAVNPGERIMEAKLQVSVLSLTSPGHEISELLLRVESPEGSLQIADYFPKTTLTTDVVGELKVERQSELTKSAELSITGASGASSAKVGGNHESHEKTSSEGHQLPPLVLCAASGTVLRGHGVYFKLCPTPRTSLEGAHDLTLRFQVPANWRADYLLVNCEATGIAPNYLGGNGARVRRGAKSFVVATYVEGDALAKARAMSLIRAERDLRVAAVTFQDQLKKGTSPDPIRELSSLFKGVDRRIPDNWLEQVMFSSTSGSLTFVDKLPTEVRVASLNYRDSKRQMQRINSIAGPTAAPEKEARTATIQAMSYVALEAPKVKRLPTVEH